MRIRMLTLMAGPAGTSHPGAIVDLPDDQARALIEGGYALAIERPVKVVPVETATIDTPETAVMRRGRPRGRAE